MKGLLSNSTKAFVLMITMMLVTSVLFGQNTCSEKQDLFIEIEAFNKSHCILYWRMEKPVEQIKFLFQNQNGTKSFSTQLKSGAMQVAIEAEIIIEYKLDGKKNQMSCNCKFGLN